jgi:hypothetical protein
VSLGRLVLAWLPVAVEFTIVGGLGVRFFDADVGRPADVWKIAGRHWMCTKWDLLWWSVEAAIVTLFASLWFDSLGHGGWWLLFLLLGVIVAVARLPQRAWQRREAVVRSIRDILRYILAGAILAWRLG